MARTDDRAPAPGRQLTLGLAADRGGEGVDQLDLPLRRLPDPASVRLRAQELADDLRHRLGAPVRLAVTDNRTSLATARWEQGAWQYRLHHLFLEADEATRRALADFAAGRRRKTTAAQLDAWIEANRHLIKVDPAAGPRAPADPAGRHHDLKAIFDRLNAEYFDDQVVARIGWGVDRRGRGRRGRRRSIKMGSYVHDARLIRIHPALDRKEVPEFYLAWVVYHEMLHQVVPPVRREGRTLYHPPEFRRLELAYGEAEAAQRWEKANFELLLGG